MARKDWLPNNHESLYNMVKTASDYISANSNRARMGFAPNTPQGQWFNTTFIPACNAFTAAFENWLNPATRTMVMTATLANAQKALDPVFRQLYSGFIKNSPLVTDGDLAGMELPKRSRNVHTPSPTPSSIPGVIVNLPSPGVVKIHFHNPETGRRAKPASVHGAEIIWAILPEPSADWSQLIQSSFSISSPLTLSFKGEERGKRLYFAIRWQNTRGIKGPLSEIRDVIIP